VCDGCNANSSSLAQLGFSFTKDTRLHGKAFFTCSYNFQTKEIEVFGIITQTILPPNPAHLNLRNCFRATLLDFQIVRRVKLSLSQHKQTHYRHVHGNSRM
jgi:hypothetical protein